MTKRTQIFCFYCGDIAGQRDHLHSFSRRAGRSRRNASNGWATGSIKDKTVPACFDCNCVILKDFPSSDIADRQKYVVEALTERLEKAWKKKTRLTDEDLEEMGPTLLSYIKAKEDEATWLQRRLDVATTYASPFLSAADG